MSGADQMPPTKMRFRISATQLKMFFECPRKWALMYLAKMPKLPSAALEDGITLHEAAADWFRLAPEAWAAKWPQRAPDGASLTEQRRAKMAALAGAMVQHAPPSKTARHIETNEWYEVPELDTALFFKVDLATDRAIVTDWKSTSADKPNHEWVLQSADWYMGVPDPGVKLLADDLQARLYGQAAMALWRTTVVEAHWVYGCKRFQEGRTPRTWDVSVKFQRSECRDWFQEKIIPAVRLMNRLREAHEAKKLAPTVVPAQPDSCSWSGRFCDALAACLFKPSPIPLGRLALPVLASNPLPAAEKQDDGGGFAALLHNN